MRSEEEIRKKIEKTKLGILDLVLQGLYSNTILQEQRNWIEALEWVLVESEDDEE